MRRYCTLLAGVILLIVWADLKGTSIPAVSEKRIVEAVSEGNEADILPVLRVMTYNIHRGINKNNTLDLDGITEVIRDSGADIVALQEVERFSIRTGFKDQIAYIADKLSMDYAFGKSMNILNGQYGNGILSKYPIEEYEVKELPSEGEQRTLFRAGINVWGSRISFYSTHLGLSQEEREKQIGEIGRLVGNCGNFILAGDFNMYLDEPGILGGRFRDCTVTENDRCRVTFEKDGLSERIDYIFASENFEVKEYNVIKADASDHYPVICVLEMKRGSEVPESSGIPQGSKDR